MDREEHLKIYGKAHIHNCNDANLLQVINNNLQHNPLLDVIRDDHLCVEVDVIERVEEEHGYYDEKFEVTENPGIATAIAEGTRGDLPEPRFAGEAEVSLVVRMTRHAREVFGHIQIGF